MSDNMTTDAKQTGYSGAGNRMPGGGGWHLMDKLEFNIYTPHGLLALTGLRPNYSPPTQLQGAGHPPPTHTGAEVGGGGGGSHIPHTHTWGVRG
jgi:hypothetical protein